MSRRSLHLVLKEAARQAKAREKRQAKMAKRAAKRRGADETGRDISGIPEKCARAVSP
jgi:hypothetical protein